MLDSMGLSNINAHPHVFMWKHLNWSSLKTKPTKLKIFGHGGERDVEFLVG